MLFELAHTDGHICNTSLCIFEQLLKHYMKYDRPKKSSAQQLKETQQARNETDRSSFHPTSFPPKSQHPPAVSNVIQRRRKSNDFTHVLLWMIAFQSQHKSWFAFTFIRHEPSSHSLDRVFWTRDSHATEFNHNIIETMSWARVGRPQNSTPLCRITELHAFSINISTWRNSD